MSDQTLWKLAQEMRSWDDGATPKDYAKAVEQWAREKAKEWKDYAERNEMNAPEALLHVLRMADLGVPEEQ